MREHKTKIITAALIIAALMVAWAYGGDYGQWTMDNGQLTIGETLGETVPEGLLPHELTVEKKVAENLTDVAEITEAPEISAVADMRVAVEITAVAEAPAQVETAVGVEGSVEGSGQDEYLDDTVPGDRPLPGWPRDVVADGGAFSVTLTVRCDTLLDNLELLSREKQELAPQDGLIFPAASVTAYEGESAFNILHRTMKQAQIQLSFRHTPVYNSAYIEAINNLYEFDAGELSGWMYSVNGLYPNYGCSRYLLNPGDVIEFSYSCDLGRDLGEVWLSGGQRDE